MSSTLGLGKNNEKLGVFPKNEIVENTTRN